MLVYFIYSLISYSTSAMDLDNCDDDTEIEELILIGIISDYIDKDITKILCRTLIHGGELWVHSIMNGNPRRCQE